MAAGKKFIRVRERNQVTLPADIIEGLPIRPGDFLEISRTPDGTLEIRPAEVVAVSRTPAATDRLKEARADIEDKNYLSFRDATQFEKHLKLAREERRASTAVGGGKGTNLRNSATGEGRPGQEERLDTVVGLRWAVSRRQAREMVRHGHVRVNGRKITAPAFHVSATDEVAVGDLSTTPLGERGTTPHKSGSRKLQKQTTHGADTAVESEVGIDAYSKRA